MGFVVIYALLKIPKAETNSDEPASVINPFQGLGLRQQAEIFEHFTGSATKSAFHLSELTGQTIPVVIRISLLIKSIQPH